MEFNFGMDEMLCDCPYQNCIALFYTTPPNIFYCTSKLVKKTCYTISEPSFKTLPPSKFCNPCVLKKVRWDSIFSWMKCSTTALFKTVLHYFIQTPLFFYCTVLHFFINPPKCFFMAS